MSSNDTREALSANPRAVLEELVAIQDLRKSLAQANHHAVNFPSDENYAVIDSLSTELARRSKDAWAAARAALTEQPAAPQEPYAWFWQDGSDSGVITTRADYDHHRSAYPRMTFVPVYTHAPAAPAQEPQQPAPTVQVLGVKADGSEHDLGTIPEVLAPKFKMREIVRSYFGHFEEGDDSQADMCMIALEEFQRWYKAGLDAVAKQPAASSTAPAVQPCAAYMHAPSGATFEAVIAAVDPDSLVALTPAVQPPTARLMLIDGGALRLAINALRRDAAEGKTVRGEIADELEKSARPAPAVQPEAVAELVEALRNERDLRLLGQQPEVHWESLRDLRRSVYAATDTVLAKHGQPQGGSNG